MLRKYGALLSDVVLRLRELEEKFAVASGHVRDESMILDLQYTLGLVRAFGQELRIVPPQLDRIERATLLADSPQLARDIRELRMRIQDDLDTTLFLHVPNPHYYTEKDLFGLEVAAKFPSLIYEIEQSGKCYACALTSASAFHSIRCLEAGVRALTRCLGIPDPTKGRDRNWGNISRSIHAELERRWPASSGRMAGDAQLFDEIYGALAGIQNPYRNATMHLDAKYTAPEALHIFEMVKGLMQKIASRMDEQGLPLA